MIEEHDERIVEALARLLVAEHRRRSDVHLQSLSPDAARRPGLDEARTGGALHAFEYIQDKG